MDSGELDFYQHTKVCSNTCRSTKIDLVGTKVNSDPAVELVSAAPSAADCKLGSVRGPTFYPSPQCQESQFGSFCVILLGGKQTALSREHTKAQQMLTRQGQKPSPPSWGRESSRSTFKVCGGAPG